VRVDFWKDGLFLCSLLEKWSLFRYLSLCFSCVFVCLFVSVLSFVFSTTLKHDGKKVNELSALEALKRMNSTQDRWNM
jgi:flagellar biosynthesis protein FlhB